jgi:hypothetical protein
MVAGRGDKKPAERYYDNGQALNNACLNQGFLEWSQQIQFVISPAFQNPQTRLRRRTNDAFCLGSRKPNPCLNEFSQTREHAVALS